MAAKEYKEYKEFRGIVFERITSLINQFFSLAGSSANVFGDGSDSNVTIVSGTTLTLSRDMNYATLTVQQNATLFPAGFRVFVQIQLLLNGTISNVGGNGLASNNIGFINFGGLGTTQQFLGGSGQVCLKNSLLFIRL